jgi:hypothetical protein
MHTVFHRDQDDGPVIRAAKRALETGNANYILNWIPEESENTLKNLLERACCERTTRKDTNNHTTDWYFETISRLHSLYYGPHHLCISAKPPEEKAIILLVERACESGNFEEISMVIPDTPAGEMRRRFNDVMKKKNSGEDTSAANRVYVSALAEFIAFVYNFQPESFL